jgi:thymidylate synthase ThyX
MTEPSAKVIEDSISPEGVRLTTMEVVFHRFVLAEFNTHRMFSRNSASSRAIPVKKMLKRVEEDPALPLSWPMEQSGMQGGESLTPGEIKYCEQYWLQARDVALMAARSLTDHQLHKSVANRLLEPFMWHTCIVSSTEWDNFFGLRCNPLAQPEIQAVAYAMQGALLLSTPNKVGYEGEWHLPYIQDDEIDMPTSTLCKVSAARCARVSYLTQDGHREIEKDIELYERLTAADPPHSSPLEHVATPINPHDHTQGRAVGNFTGWAQLRHQVGK